MVSFSRDGHASIVKALIDAKADVKVVNTKTKESPLHFAVQYRGKVHQWHCTTKVVLGLY